MAYVPQHRRRDARQLRPATDFRRTRPQAPDAPLTLAEPPDEVEAEMERRSALVAQQREEFDQLEAGLTELFGPPELP